MMLKARPVKRFYSSFDQASILSKYPIGLNYHGFKIEDVRPIPEFSLVAVKLIHAKGGQHLHLHTDNDRNNVFSIAFKTNPPDNTGVPHILEHTTLCGSYKYPVRDPFFKMLNRSLSNFMNAMTGHDYTFFPFATTNGKDFENLMDVYLSSTLEPLLKYEDFTQEGWRLENEVVDDIKSPLTFKGVVYNEMKGQYSNSGYYYYIKFQEAIYKSLNNSGGDPQKITNLEYEDLIDFHQSSYHPSNAKTFTYGSLPLVHHLEKLNSYYTRFGMRKTKNIIRQPNVNTWDKEVVMNGPVDVMGNKPIEEQYQSSVTYYLGDPLQPNYHYEIFKWKILNSLLCDGHSSPFYQELIEKNYGEDFSVNSGLDSTTALLSFSIGLTNLTTQKVDGLNNKINEILTQVLPKFTENSPVFQKRVEAILHQLELSFKKHKPDFGLGLLNSVVSTWINDVDPLETLQVEKILNRFKNDYKEQGLKVFEDMIKTLLSPETPKFKFTMKPDEKFSEKLVEEENQRLLAKTINLTDEDKQIIFERSQKLLEKQQTEEDVSVLPTLSIYDIPRQGEFHNLQFGKVNDKVLQKRVVDTNGLVYSTASKDLSYLPPKYYVYMPLFISCLTNLAGTEKTSIIDLESRIQSTTGGISFSLSNKTDPYDISNTKLKFLASGMSLSQNSSHIYDLWHEILTSTKFTEEEEVLDKLTTLIKNMGSNQMDSIAERGHSYANAYTNSQLTSSKNIRNTTSGMEQVEFVMKLNKDLEIGGKDFLKKEILPVLQIIQKLVVEGSIKSGFEYNLIGDSKTISENESLIQKFDDSFKTVSYEDELTNFIDSFNKSPISQSRTLFDLPFQIGYASLGKLGSSYASKDGAALQVLSHLLTTSYLHSAIRESNGAYGGGLNYDGLGGTLNYYSYRDPNALKSVESFKKSYNVALEKIEKNWDTKDLQEAKLSIFQSIDAPSNINQQGLSNFIEGISDEMKQGRRERFLDVSNEDLKNVAEKYLLGGEKEIVTIIGDNSKISVGEGWDIKSYTN